MLVATKGDAMAKKVGRPKKPGGEGKSVRIDEEIVSKARIVAARNGLPLSDYLAGLLRSSVDRDYRKAVQEMASEEKGGAK